MVQSQFLLCIELHMDFRTAMHSERSTTNNHGIFLTSDLVPEIILSICPYALELPPGGNCPVQVFVILQDGCSFPSCVQSLSVPSCFVWSCLVCHFPCCFLFIFLSVPFFILFGVFGHPFDLLFISIGFCLAWLQAECYK